MRAALLLLSLAAVGALRPAPARAQGTVTGRVTLVERGGRSASDVDQAVVYLESTPTATLPPWASASGTIAMRGREFLPHVRVVAAGGEVAFPNEDPYSHNVFSNTVLAGFDLGLYRRGATRSARFARAGVYPIYCNIHHRMVSFVVAAPNAFVVQPGPDGAFAIRGVPAGGYTLHAWHERAGEWAEPVVVVAGGSASVRVELDARPDAPEQHLNKFGLPYTATRADRY